MIEKGRISALQMSLLIYANIVSSAILTVPGITYKYAGRDMWLSPIWGSLSGFFVVFIVYQLNKLYPMETLIQYIQHILGQIPGKIVGFFYLFFYLYAGGTALRQYGDFLVGAFFNRTPILIVIASLALASTFAVRAGLEVLARLSDMFVPLMILLWIMIVLLLIPELDVKNMFPIMENGIKPSIMGAVSPAAWYTIFFHISTLFPFLIDRKQGMKWSMFTVLAVLVTLLITNLATLLLFGGITGSFVFPFMSAARYISYADFFENLESVIMAIWIGGTFIKMGLYNYVLVLNTAQWLNLSDYKPLVLPFWMLLTLVGIWTAPNLPELAHSLSVTGPIISHTYFIVIPVILLLIAVLRNRMRQKAGKP
ncbi:GerAB/ArcD/ProY family transporter [Paenibacillus prosopidis]|uniref:Spore germination protein KB n=1 Tax=Paenibacillus prosopidis TaxID=630520 RepID=A0A368VPN8_9BACL|nr:endospore germination permease [Paenibacillus prosopidis]RCW43464.1 spore germination protein KB [Paenibacillus prosopidis]